MLYDLEGQGCSIHPTDTPTPRPMDPERLQRQLAAARRRIAMLRRERSRHRRAIRRLTAMATTDVLTDLGNRRRFEELLGLNFALSTGYDSPLSLILVDVDEFKSYNDEFGHAAGDAVLCVIAQQLVRSSRAQDVVTRYGGEEFAIVLPEAGAAAALDHAERQREAIATFAWPLRPVTASFGVATRTPSIADVARLVDGADRALYVSKRGGRNRVTHVETIHERDPFHFPDLGVAPFPRTVCPGVSDAGIVSATIPSNQPRLSRRPRSC